MCKCGLNVVYVDLVSCRSHLSRSRPWNSDQNCTQNSARGGKGQGVGIHGWWGQVGW